MRINMRSEPEECFFFKETHALLCAHVPAWSEDTGVHFKLVERPIQGLKRIEAILVLSMSK